MKRDHARPKVISLYTGAGGLDLGFEAAGYETRVAVEKDPDAVATLQANRPAWNVVPHDIHSDPASSKHLMERADLRVGDADLLVGGPPCQPFSKSGYWARGDVRRLEDPRATTLEAYLRVLRDTQPRAFLLENVPGLAYEGKKEGLDLLRRTIDAINSEIKTQYSFEVGMLRAVEHGVPQDRLRVFIVGARDGTVFKFPKSTHSRPTDDTKSGDLLADLSEKPLETPLTAWDAIGDLEEDDDPALRVGGKWADLLPSIPEGRNYLYHTGRGEGLPLFGWRTRYWSFLLKLAKALPSWTLTADPGSAIGPFHWRNRRLSATELLRLQTFPEGYCVKGGYRASVRQLGNAVPSALAERLGLEIRKQLLGEPSLRSDVLSLIPLRRDGMPEPEPTTVVPERYQFLVGKHDAHPGPGLGPGARSRVTPIGF